jgi:addiction module RelE/StbE family toxin
VEWSPLAVADRNRIFDHIEQDSPRAAVAVDDRIREQVAALIRFPEQGRPGRVEGTRELVISHTPYLVAYRISGEVVLVLRVLHGAQLWSGGLP